MDFIRLYLLEGLLFCFPVSVMETSGNSTWIVYWSYQQIPYYSSKKEPIDCETENEILMSTAVNRHFDSFII